MFYELHWNIKYNACSTGLWYAGPDRWTAEEVGHDHVHTKHYTKPKSQSKALAAVLDEKVYMLKSTRNVQSHTRGGRRSGIHCMHMRNDFRINYSKSVRTPIPTTCWQVKRSICLKNTGWPPDLYTSARAKYTPTLFGGLCKSTWQRLSNYFEISLKIRTVQPVISGYIEHEELRSKGKYIRQYLYIIRLFKICIITAHACAVSTRPSLPSPSRRPGDEAKPMASLFLTGGKCSKVTAQLDA